MKKISLFLFLTITTLSNVCMEKERSRPVINSLPPHINDAFHLVLPTLPICVAMESNWQQLNAIGNMTYKRNQPIIADEIELTPVYRPTPPQNNALAHKKKIEQQETKPFLRTIAPVQPDPDLMENVYNNAHLFVTYQQNAKRHDWMIQNKSLVDLINIMNCSRATGINEDLMGKFAHKPYVRNAITNYVPLVFSCLKRYTLTVNDTKEDLPFDFKDYPNQKLAQALNIPYKEVPKIEITNSALEPYPAYAALMINLKKLTSYTDYAIYCTISSLYGDEKILFEGCSPISYSDLTHKFYHEAYSLLINKGTCLDMYNALRIIEKAKTSKAIKKSVDLISDILNFYPTTTVEEFFDLFTSKEDIIIKNRTIFNAKNRMCLFLHLVEKYNDAQANKITPTSQQYYCYDIIKNSDLALPDYFNSTLFNEDYYAFAAFEQLINDTTTLIRADDKDVQQYIDQLYPQKK